MLYVCVCVTVCSSTNVQCVRCVMLYVCVCVTACRSWSSSLYCSFEGSSTAAVYGASGQAYVQCLRRLLCHSATSSKGNVKTLSLSSSPSPHPSLFSLSLSLSLSFSLSPLSSLLFSLPHSLPCIPLSLHLRLFAVSSARTWTRASGG